ncbi:outer membrane receptor protein involved in Fe transport [Chitinophaga skermanii]|uniref:Outer membrane receptor protein involved in Fe transport n=1 Tax=Chitinophaga skermanii TaxID=331697 RepID=A0A327QKH1_9BACT|nr:outer membrane beta-barrel protein [Chitinophaga skermanii]RAJ05146.1 outer membrane receptor protein involved in Fe transport [Chitinophaga skermanii]
MRTGFLAILTFIALPTFAQQKLTVAVSNSQLQPLPYASIEVLRVKDSSLVKGQMSDSIGTTVFDVPYGHYLLRGKMINHNTGYLPVQFSSSQQRFTIQLNTQQLQTVTINKKKPLIQQSPGKTTVNVEAAITNAGTTVLELLEKSPGVSVDRDGNISLKGKQGVLVLIDDKPTYLSGQELASLLGSMNSSQIEQLELMDNPPAKYDAAGGAGVINIKTKKLKQYGFNGNATIGHIQGRYARETGNVNLNYKSGNLNAYLNYSGLKFDNYMRYTASRQFKEAGTNNYAQFMEQDGMSYLNGLNNTVRAGVDYTLSKNTSVGVGLVGTLQKRDAPSFANVNWLDGQRHIDSVIRTDSRVENKWRNGGATLYVRHKLNQRQDIGADVDFSKYRIAQDQSFTNSLMQPVGYIESSRSDILSNLRILTGKIDYTYQISDKTNFSAGAKVSQIDTDNDAQYYVKDTHDDWVSDDNQTNHFIYKENIYAAYASAEQKAGKMTIGGGLRFESTQYTANQIGNKSQGSSSFDRSYNSLFPTLNLTYQLDSSHQLMFSGGRRIDRPVFQNLNPFVVIINKYSFQSGNPNLLPQYTWQATVSHVYKEWLTTSFGYVKTSGYFMQMFLTRDDGTLLFTHGNLGDYSSWVGTVTVSKDITKWWAFNGTAVVNFKHLEGTLWEHMDKRRTQLSLNISNQLRLGKDWTAEVSGWYESKSMVDIQEVLDPMGQLQLGLAKQVLKGKGTLKLSARDVLYTQVLKGFTTFEHSTEPFTLRRDTRNVGLSFTYRFGKPIKGFKRNNSGPSDEAQRVGNAG